jgi:hypothetical protein
LLLDQPIGHRHAVVARLGRSCFGRGVGFGLEYYQDRSDRDLVADLAGHFEDLAGHRRFHLHGRLVGHHVGDLLVLADHVADLDVPGDDFGLGYAFADVWKLEFVARHRLPQFSRACFSARASRSGPGK